MVIFCQFSDRLTEIALFLCETNTQNLPYATRQFSLMMFTCTLKVILPICQNSFKFHACTIIIIPKNMVWCKVRNAEYLVCKKKVFLLYLVKVNGHKKASNIVSCSKPFLPLVKTFYR